ncbi:MAG: hypothetical protein OEN50_13970 [Deltaproteobacteria bacterium]|nr:hypothetical protein [Deltaproteobacteria bacterium]
MKRIATVLVSLFVMGIYGCASLGQSISVKTSDLRGRIEGKVYTSPTGTFRVRLPPLSSDGIEINDDMPSQSTLRLTVKDDLCREFIVSQRPGYLGTQSLAQWVDEHIVEPLNSEGFKLEKPKTIETRQGTVISLRYKVPGGAPCVSGSVKEGKPVETRFDADVGWYILHNEGAVYRLIYVLGLVTEKPGSWITQFLIKRGPVDEVLAEFAEGFDIIAVKNN